MGARDERGEIGVVLEADSPGPDLRRGSRFVGSYTTRLLHWRSCLMNRRKLLRSAGLGALAAPALGSLSPSAEAREPEATILQAQANISTGNYTFAGESDLVPGVGSTVMTPQNHHIIINGTGTFSRRGITGGGTITHY